MFRHRQALYNSFDANGDGIIDFDEFRQVLEADGSGGKVGSGIPGVQKQSGSRPMTGRSTKSVKSNATLKRLKTLGLLRPRTAEHHKKRVYGNLPKVEKFSSTKKAVKRGMRSNKPGLDPRAWHSLNRKWNIHAKDKYVHDTQPFADFPI